MLTSCDRATGQEKADDNAMFLGITRVGFGNRIPTRNDAIQILADDRVVGGFDNDCQASAGIFCLLFMLPHVYPVGDLNCVNENGIDAICTIPEWLKHKIEVRFIRLPSSSST
jgi:hypothetical protein